MKCSLKVFLPAGAFTVAASTALTGAQGQFGVAYTLTSNDVTGCETAFITRGATSGRQSISQSDCVISSTRSEDRFRVWLPANRPLNIHLQDQSYSDQYIEPTDATGQVLGASTLVGYYDYTLTFTPPADGYYDIRPHNEPHQGIEYILWVR